MADANAQTFNFELVSPDKVLVSEPAWQVVIPGEEGYFGVRAGHMSLIAAVRAGGVEVTKKEGDAPRRIFIAGGFADVTAKNCTLLAEQALDVADIDAATVERDIANINEDLKSASDLTAKPLLHHRLQLATLQLNAVRAA